MTYTKPELNILGDAASVIQGIPKGLGVHFDPETGVNDFDPAYDLDE